MNENRPLGRRQCSLGGDDAGRGGDEGEQTSHAVPTPVPRTAVAGVSLPTQQACEHICVLIDSYSAISNLSSVGRGGGNGRPMHVLPTCLATARARQQHRQQTGMGRIDHSG